ncbi:MAG: hypothetical protein IT162_01010 [Bryobacterales bacterium]|nr:hypothetical protein [Bryobacterales bacterium]
MTQPPLQEPVDKPYAPLAPEGWPIFKYPVVATSLRQQRLTNCPLPAILAAMANAAPQRLHSMITEYPAQAESWFWNTPVPHAGRFRINRVIKVKFQYAAIPVSPILYFDNLYHPRFTMCSNGDGWASYIEKAYVIHRGSFHYANLNFLGGGSATPVERVMEDLVHEFLKFDLDERVVYRDLELNEDNGKWETANWREIGARGMAGKLRSILAQARRKPTVATTPSSAANHADLDLVGQHTYAVLRYRDNNVTLFDAMRARELTITVRQLLAGFDNVYQAM